MLVANEADPIVAKITRNKIPREASLVAKHEQYREVVINNLEFWPGSSIRKAPLLSKMRLAGNSGL